MSERKPLALLIRNAASYDFGGAERFVISLSRQLAGHGWEARIVTRHARIQSEAAAAGVATVKGWWWRRQDWSGARIVLTPLYICWQLLLLGWYLQLFIRLRPTVVHVQSKDDFIAATWAARLLAIRVIWTDHADLKYIYQNVRIWYKNPVGKLVRCASRAAMAITLVSKSERRLVQAALGQPLSPRYQVVYNGIVDAALRPVARRKQDATAVVFCATSRLVTAKGIGELIAAFHSLDERNLRLWLIGDGPDEQVFRAQAGDDQRITFHGFSPHALQSLAAADVFVHPSYHEGFSLSIVEAAMLGKPIIACNVGGNPEIVVDHHTGLLIPAQNASALADAMRTLAQDKTLRSRLGQNARAAYEAHFQFDTIVTDQFMPLYEKKH